jgi:hypothetical protein
MLQCVEARSREIHMKKTTTKPQVQKHVRVKSNIRAGLIKLNGKEYEGTS